MLLEARAVDRQVLVLRGTEEASNNFINILESIMEETGKIFKLHESKIKCYSPATHNEVLEIFYH